MLSAYAILTVHAPATPAGEVVGSPPVSSGPEYTCVPAASNSVSIAVPVEPAFVEWLTVARVPPFCHVYSRVPVKFLMSRTW